MQTTDAASLLQILQAPAGAALLPMLNDRERMVMDQSNATLQDTLSRTSINQDENRRANEKQPLTLAQLQAQTEGQKLQNQDAQFDQGVKTSLGPDFYVNQAKQGAAKSDAAILAEGAKNAPAIAAAVRAAGPAAKTTAMEMLKRFNFPQSLIAQVEQEQDPQQVIKNMDAFAESIAKMSRQYFQQESVNQNRVTTTNLTNVSREKIAEIKARSDRALAELKAKLKASGGPPDSSLNKVLGRLLLDINDGIDKNDQNKVDRATLALEQFTNAYKPPKPPKPDAPPSVKETRTTVNSDGSVTSTERKIPDTSSTSKPSKEWVPDSRPGDPSNARFFTPAPGDTGEAIDLKGWGDAKVKGE